MTRLKAATVAVLTASAGVSAASVNVDFDNQVATSSGLMFGLSSWPKLDAKYAEDIADAGVTIIRSDIYLYDIIPDRDVFDKDPSEWNWNPEDPTESTSEDEINALNDAGLDHMLIIHGIPEWMGTEGESPSWDGDDDSLPVTDYDALSAAYKEVFAHYQDQIEYFQIANEPDLSMTYDDYTSIYKEALAGMNEVNTDKPVGPQIAEADPDDPDLEEPHWYKQMMDDPEIAPNVRFADWHSYGETWNANAGSWREISTDAGREDMPLFVSEWNHTPSYDDGDTVNGDTPEAVSFTGMKLSGMMDAGVTGSMLFGTNDETDKYDADLRHPFPFITSDGELSAKAATFRLLSKGLGLGAGENKITNTGDDGVSASCSAINSGGQRVAWAINNTDEEVKSSVSLDNTGQSDDVELTHYLASVDNDAKEPLKTETKTVDDNGHIDTTITLPPYSVYGIVVGG